MFVFSASTLAIIALSGVTAALLGAWLFRKDTEAEARKRAAIVSAGMLSSLGLVRLPKLLECYAINDWSGLASQVKQLAEMSLDPKALASEFDLVFARMVDAKLKTDEGRVLLTSKLAS